MAPSPRFWNRIARRYARQPVADEAAYQRKLEVTRGFLRPGMEVLDFGAGTGSTSLTLAPLVGHITAIDYSPAMIGIAREKARAAGVENVRFEVSTIEDWQAAEHSYDAVFGNSILHFLDDRDAVIARVYRLLKPGGIFVSSTACLTDLNPALRLLLPLVGRLGLIPRVRVFSKDDLVAALRRAGFHIEHDWKPGPGKAAFLVARAA